MQPIRPDIRKLLGAGCSLAFGIVWTLFSFVFLLFAWLAGAPWYFMLFDIPFLVIGVSLIGRSAWPLFIKPRLLSRSFGPATAELSSHRLRVGERVSVRYERAARRDLKVTRVLIQLILRESATYRRGTNTYTALHDNIIDEHERPGRRVYRGDVVTEECSLRVPPNGMPTFMAMRNKLVWLVRIQMELPGAPDVSDEIVVQVVPELAEGRYDAS